MKIKNIPFGIVVAFAIAVISVATRPVHAEVLFALDFGANSTSSNNTLTGASGSVGFTFTDEGDDVRVTLGINNTTGSTLFGDNATSSKLTGFGFDLLPGVSFVSGSFVEDTDKHFTNTLLDVKLQQQESLDFAVADNNKFNGGNANGALPQNDSANVGFLLDDTRSAADLGAAFQAAFFSVPTLQGSMRFQQVEGGNNNDASDKLRFNPPTVMPLPAGLLLMLSALGVIGLMGRQRVA